MKLCRNLEYLLNIGATIFANCKYYPKISLFEELFSVLFHSIGDTCPISNFLNNCNLTECGYLIILAFK